MTFSLYYIELFVHHIFQLSSSEYEMTLCKRHQSFRKISKPKATLKPDVAKERNLFLKLT